MTLCMCVPLSLCPSLSLSVYLCLCPSLPCALFSNCFVSIHNNCFHVHHSIVILCSKKEPTKSVVTLFMELIKSSLTLCLTLRCVHMYMYNVYMYMNLCTCVNISVLRIFLMTTVTFGKTCFQVSYFNQAETKFNSKNLKLKREKIYISVYQCNCLQRHLVAY